VTNVTRAKYPVVNMHTHVFGQNDQEIVEWLKAIDVSGIEKAIILTGATNSEFDTIMKIYSKYGNRFELWCGFDYNGYDKPGYGPEAVKELERCFKAGASGVGEEMFKEKVIGPLSKGKTIMIPDDSRLDSLFEKCAELKLPVNLHISEDKWMYEIIDSTNDGLMNDAS
jgi:predicted TIM-barrel fold metal-dependent hydrolase